MNESDIRWVQRAGSFRNAFSRLKEGVELARRREFSDWGVELTHSVLSRIDTELDDLLLPYMIDLSIFNQIENPAMIQQIQRDGVNLYEKSDRGEWGVHHERDSFTGK